MRSRDDIIRAWAASGAMALTGRRDGPPLGPPEPLVDRIDGLADRLAGVTAAIGTEVRVDPLTLLTERAALARFTRQGPTSCGGGTRLLPTADGWLALALPRPADVELVPAWLQVDHAAIGVDGGRRADDGLWQSIAAAVRARAGAGLEARGAELGLALAEVPDARPGPAPAAASLAAPFTGLPVELTWAGAAPPRSLEGSVVVDLSSLWAGPLCGRLLADAGATVVKVESSTRPDGARAGPAAFFDLMNAGKASVAVDLRSPQGRGRLAELVAGADVVIEASRPRALEQLGVDAWAAVGTGPQVWLSITGHGRDGPGRDRVAFGDDAAAAGGLVVWDAGVPLFCADAVADPCAGLVAAVAAAEGLAAGGRWLIDVAMARVAAHLAGPTLAAAAVGEVAAPALPRSRGSAPMLGADDDRVVAGRLVGR